MDFPIFECDSYFDQMYRPVNWTKDSVPIDLIDLEKSSCQNNLFDNLQINNQRILKKKIFSNECFNTQCSISEDFDKNIKKSKSKICKDSKVKKIYKQQKHNKIPINTKINFQQSQSLQKSYLGKIKSKYNNMAGFLIGTVSEILNNKNQYKFQNGCFYIEVDKTWIIIEKVEIAKIQMVQFYITSLKEKIFHLPRKEGAKKHLIKIINSDSEDSEQIKITKNLLRRQLIYALNQQNWLLTHVNSRDFKPQNDSELGTKKQKRHQAYLQYLKAMRSALQIKGCIPKRMTL